MNRLIFKIALIAFVVSGLTSCLDGDNGNIPTDVGDSPILQMTWNPNEGTNLNAGLNYFNSQALTFPITDDADTTSFAVTLQGPNTLGSDISVTAVVKMDAKGDNYANDSIEYLPMPDDAYDFLVSTSTIKAGDRTGEFQIIFHPNKLDPTLSYILPVTATNASDLPLSSNYGIVYFHVIGNPIAGTFSWDYIRYNDQTKTGASSGFTEESTTFAPVSPTSIKVPTGYYVQPNYLITFKNTDGVLSDFKAVIAPDEIKAAFTDNNIEVVSGPTITVNEDYTRFEINYVVFNGSAYRNLTDIYYK
ncbi:MAG TPA: DUF1735 domain-containing protein [Ohtaekwangia sp.]|uniref:DUF1735 domain-containing protein n=1 Tax=Ohtaekwangia sp. TaxID=2066019 RepID=UPI002F95B000